MHCFCSKKSYFWQCMCFWFLFLPSEHSEEGIFIVSFLFIIVLLRLFCCSESVLSERTMRGLLKVRQKV